MANSTASVPAETLCKLLDLTPRRVQQLSAQGIIPRAERGRYELAPAIRNYVRYLREQQGGEPGGKDDWATHRARKVKEQADAQALKNAVTRGELLDREEVTQAVTAAFARVRAKLLSLPTKVAPLVVGMRVTATIKATIEHGVHEALRELAATEIVGDRTAPKPSRKAAARKRQPDAAGGGAGLVADPGAAADADGKPVGGRRAAAQPRGQRRAR